MPFRRLLRNKRGSVAMVVALIVTIAVLIIGIYMLTTFQEAMPQIGADENATENITATNIFSAGWSAFGLAVIIPIIVVAGAIIGYLVKGFSGGR